MEEKKVATIFDLKRFCKAHVCTSCAICEACRDDGTEFNDKDNKIILDWCEKHPVKTRTSELLKTFPNVELSDNGFPRICPKILDQTLTYDNTCKGVPCLECEKKYWTEEIK